MFLEKQATLAAAGDSSSCEAATQAGRLADGKEAERPADSAQQGNCGAEPAAADAATAGIAAATEPAAAVAAQKAAPQPEALSDLSPTEQPSTPALAESSADIQQSRVQHGKRPAAGLSLRGARCLDLSAGCGLVGEV